MKDKIFNVLKSKTLFALAINITVMGLIVAVTSFSYDSADDFYNSLRICQQHFYYSGEINYIFATVVGSLQYILMNFNCFVLLQITLSCAAFSSITFVFADKFGKPRALAFALALNILFSFDHYSNILSSKTAALLLAAGVLLTLNSIRNKRYTLSFWTGLAQILLGSFLCFKYFFVAPAFFVAFFAGDMIVKRKYKLPFRKFFWYFRPFALVLVFTLLLGFGLEYYSYSVNNNDSETAGYYEYSTIVSFTDDNAFPEYEDYEDEFKEMGISSSYEYSLLIDGYYDSDNGLGSDALRLVAEIQHKEIFDNAAYNVASIFSDMWDHIASFDSYFVIYAAVIVVMALLIILQKKRWTFFAVFYLAIMLMSFIYVRFAMNSREYETMYGVFLMAVSFCLYSFDFENLRSKKEHVFASKKTSFTVCVFCLAVLCMCSAVCYYSHLTPVSYNKKPSDLYTEVDRHPENYYILDPVSAKDYVSHTDNYTHPLWGFTKNFLSNVDSFGYLNRTAKLASRGLSLNIYESAVGGERVYVIDKNIVFDKEKYFNTYYRGEGPIIAYNSQQQINGYTIYAVKPVGQE